MQKSKTCHIHDLILYIFRHIPLHSTGALLLMAVNALLPAAQTLATANFVDTAALCLNGRAVPGNALQALLLIILCLFGTNLFPSLQEFLLSAGKQRISLPLRQQLTAKRSRLAFVHIENHDSQDLADRISNDPETRFMMAFANVTEVCQLLLTVASILFIIMEASPLSAIAVVLVSIPFYRLALKTGKNSFEMHRDAQKIQRRYQYLADVLTRREYAEERTLFQYADILLEKYTQLYQQSYQIEKKMQIKSYCNLKSGSVITTFLAVLIIGLLLGSFLSGQMTLGTLTALTGAVWNLVQSMSWQLSDAMFFLAQSREFCRDLTAFLALEEKKDAAALPSARTQTPFRSLEFKDVSFQYPDSEKKILDHCSFRLENGQQYAFVGENGAGKTTIIKLLLGLYDNYTGQILLNSQDLRTIPYGDLKGMLAVVSQDFARYELTVRENIQLGDFSGMQSTDSGSRQPTSAPHLQHKQSTSHSSPAARLQHAPTAFQPSQATCHQPTAARLQHALTQSGLSDTINRLPSGIETPLGRLSSKSTDLSGGQWQRLAIARLLYANAPINILDEPTAALDPLQESRLYQTFQDACRHSFAIYITHRLGAARIADQILVLADGKIAEYGNHDALMQIENGYYKQMYESQRSWYE